MIQFSPMKSFGELLTEYMKRTGISDSELARSIGVQRQTIFRWKEGSVARPRVREDVLHCATRLRLSPEERDLLLLAAGFPPETPVTLPSSTPIQSADSLDTSDFTAEQTTPEDEQSSPPAAFSAASNLTAIDTAIDTDTDVDAQAASTTVQSWLRRGWILPILLLLGVIGVLLPRVLPGIEPEATPTPVVITIEAPPTETTAPTPLPTATLEQAKEGEALILIAEFENFTGNQGYNMAGRLQEALMEAVRSNGLSNVRTLPWTQNIRSEVTAKQLLLQTKATLVIWGEYDSGRVVIRYADGSAQRQLEQTLKSPDQLPVVINNDTPKEVKALALATLGQIYRKNSDFAKAKKVLTLVMQLNPEADDIRARTLFYLARIAEVEASNDKSQEHYNLAIDYYTQLAQLNPQPEEDWINIWYNRGNVYTNRARIEAKASPELYNDLSAAISDYDHTIQLLPRYWQALLNRGTALYERKDEGDLAQALADFEQAIQLAPNESNPYFMHGLALLRRDIDANWENDFLKVRSMRPQDVAVHVALCWGYVVSNQFEKASSECAKVRELSDDDPEHADLQALLLAQNGDLKDAAIEANRHLQWIHSQPAQLFEKYNGPLVEAWITQLEQGENPFDEAMIDQLRLGE